MYIMFRKKSTPPHYVHFQKKLIVFTYCYLYMHGYRASIGAWVPQSPLSVACICMGVETSIGAWVPQSSLRAICMFLDTGPSIEAQVVS